MALNKFMHPRNIYKKKRPDFKQLAIKYADFRSHVSQDLSGKVHLDFKKPESLRALTRALLKDDFGLDLDMPLDRLVPTVPQRLNYILWLEDIIGTKEVVYGIDIGAGASCIYPILGCRKNGWNFVATDVDDKNLEYARKNVQNNSMDKKITVLKIETDYVLSEVLRVGNETYDFCMCNPPFFADHLDAQSVMTARSVHRPPPVGATNASDVESIAEGGEVEFVKKIIEDSLKCQEKIRVYTTMLGKKSSLGQLKNELRKHKITNFSTTEFCQGRTMRWALAWTFDPSVIFPKSTFQEGKEKNKPPMLYTIPKFERGDLYNVEGIALKIQELLAELKMEFTTLVSSNREFSVCAKAVENTWTKQRQKRRQQERARTLSGNEATSGNEEVTSCKVLKTDNTDSHAKASASTSDVGCHSDGLCDPMEGSHDHESVDPSEKDFKKCNGETPYHDGCSSDNPTVGSTNSAVVSEQHGRPEKPCILRCFISLKQDGECVNLQLKLAEGQSRDLMYQLLQYFKNKLK